MNVEGNQNGSSQDTDIVVFEQDAATGDGSSPGQDRSQSGASDNGSARSPMSVEELCLSHEVDMAHARHVAALSLALFDGLPQVHQLPAARRQLLEAAALLHNIGMNIDPAEHHVAGRDILLAEPIAGYGPEERDMLACTTQFHRKRVRAEREPTFRALPKRLRRETLALAAILRVGDALDYSQTQTSRILSIQVANGEVRVLVAGPAADEEVTRARQKADLWNEVFSTPIELFAAIDTPGVSRESLDAEVQPVSVAEALPMEPAVFTSAKGVVLPTAAEQTEQDRPSPPEPPRKTPGVHADDLISEAARKVLAFHFHRLLDNEDGTIAGEDIEALHDMRVASRRLRAAMRLFGPYLAAKQVHRLEAGLKRTGRALGDVRDLDVMLERAQTYRASLPEPRQAELQPVLDQWGKQRKKARKHMLTYLRSKDYDDFKRAFRRFLEAKNIAAEPADPSAVAPVDRVRYVMPGLIWDHYAQVWAYEQVLENAPVTTLHALRIDCKRLRYTLEFIRETLGERGEVLIADVTAAQEHLGDIHDAYVAGDLLRDFLADSTHQTRDKRRSAPSVEGIHSYLASIDERLQERLATFPAIWHRLNNVEFRRALGEVMADL